MTERDPLEHWLMGSIFAREANTKQRGRLRADLKQLDSWLSNPPDQPRRTVPGVRDALFGGRLDLADLPLVCVVHQKLLGVTGKEKNIVENQLISLVARAELPEAVPFFVGMLDLAPPRDKFGPQRRELALAGLALLAYRHDTASALAALHNAVRHERPDVRAAAIYYLSCIYVGVDVYGIGTMFGAPSDDSAAKPVALGEDPPLRRVVPAELVAELGRLAHDDPAFAPRFLARDFLRAVRQPLPLEYPGGAFVLSVRPRNSKLLLRTLALRSEQTLDDLHLAIQDALGWDADHLYSFFLSGERDDSRTTLASPYEEDNPPWADEAPLGDLALRPKHTFLYLFDYGDNHEFSVRVDAVQPLAEPGDYPRLLAAEGENPLQYPYAEDWEEG